MNVGAEDINGKVYGVAKEEYQNKHQYAAKACSAHGAEEVNDACDNRACKAEGEYP